MPDTGLTFREQLQFGALLAVVVYRGLAGVALAAVFAVWVALR